METHEENFEIEIDRENLCKYNRGVRLTSCLFLSWFLAIFNLLDRLGNGFFGTFQFDLIGELLKNLAIVSLIFTSLGLVSYFIFFHRQAKKAADFQSLKVEGAFLNIGSLILGSKISRKIHFRAITDFSVTESSFMDAFGIKELSMNTTSGNEKGAIRIRGIKNAEEVRDMLAEIDSQREDRKI